MKKNNIPFNKPFLDQREQNSAVQSIKTGFISGNKNFGQRAELALRTTFKAEFCLLTTSCTHALEMAMICLDIDINDEVIVPSYTFVSTALAVIMRGAKPVFAEIDPKTLNIDPEDIRSKITNRTKAIVPVHYAGVSCNMEAIMEIAEEFNLWVVEDAAQGVDAKYKDKYLGTIGDIGCYSFHETKNIVCGEGGAFITNNPEFAQKAEIIREKGTNRSNFLRGEVDKYSWIGQGSSYVLSDILSAVLLEQINKRKQIKIERERIWFSYYTFLSEFSESGKIYLPTIPDDCNSNYHIFFFRVRTHQEQKIVLSELREKSIQATFHYIPLHSSPFIQSHYKKIDNLLPVTDLVSQTIIRLPIYPSLTVKDTEYVIKCLQEIISKL